MQKRDTMQFKNLLKSGFVFDDTSHAIEFKYHILNSVMILAAIFSLLFAVLSDLGINDLGPIHTKVDYIYSATMVLLLLGLRQSRSYYKSIAVIFMLASYLCFVSVLLFVLNDEFRIIWFYFLIFITYVLLGTSFGILITIMCLIAILLGDRFADLQLQQTTIYTASLGLIIGSFLSRIYTVQIGRYEQILENKNLAMANTVSELDTALEKSKEASRTKSLFLANMSHEIRTPLNGVLGMVQVMHSTRLDEQQQHYLETIERSGKTLLMLIDDLLDITKIEAGKLKLDVAPFDTFNWVIDMQVISEPLFEDSRVAFVSDISDDLPSRLEGDSQRLLQVVVNLISNAAKFTHEGEVRLNIDGHMLNNDTYCLRISVEDTGIGMPQDKLQHIFDAFQQVSPERITNKGVGLGLAISKRLVDAMGGAINAYSEEGKGSRFELELKLPLASDEADRKQKREGYTDNGKRYDVLLVDDDPINRLAVGTLLQQQGNRVVEADNGIDALDKISSQKFDVILMDVHMPEMDGVEATRKIRSSANKKISVVPIIGLTASVMSDEKHSYLEAGMNAVVEKPVIGENLFRVIVECVRD